MTEVGFYLSILLMDSNSIGQLNENKISGEG
jgi:hypothetical protein